MEFLSFRTREIGIFLSIRGVGVLLLNRILELAKVNFHKKSFVKKIWKIHD